ncbi:MAG: response regulator transcription factor [Chloroflexaceae bacterium]|nr:response regulator transcription factor [Chloroflexaceae bacterium]
MTVIRILIADDHPVVRTGLHGMLAGQAGFSVIGEARTGAEAVALALRLQPDVVLMDLRMPEMDGIAAVKALREKLPGTHVLVLTSYVSDYDVRAALDAGAKGYLLKDAPREELYRAIRLAAAGKPALGPGLAERILPYMTASANLLSEREIEILRLVAQGRANKEIAHRLHISEATVKTHLGHIYRKLDVADRAAAVAVALQRGLFTTGEG